MRNILKKTAEIKHVFFIRSKEEKDKEKAANAALIEEYGFCTMDGHKEKIGNFRYLCLYFKEMFTALILVILQN